MEPSIQGLLKEIEAAGLENDARETERRRKRLNLEPDTAQLLSILIRNGRRTRLLEIGTSNGYSTIWLAWAVQQMGQGGHVTSIERFPEKQAMADENLRRAGVREYVTLLLGDATEQIRQLSGPFDCVFFDADRLQYPEQLALVIPLLTPDALVLADNVHSHPDEIAGYLEALAASNLFDHVVVGVGKGLSIAYRVR